MQSRFTQRGVTLIEMMIALVLSLVLVAGVGTVYLSSKRNYQSRDQLSLINETGRVALETLRNHLEHAGYSTPQKLPIGNYFYVDGDPDPVSFVCGGTTNIKDVNDLIGRGTKDEWSAYGDSIAIRFIGDDYLFSDAAGGSLPVSCRVGKGPALESSFIYNAFHISTDGVTKDSTGTLIPILYVVGSNINNKQPLVNGVQYMQFLYGVDNDLDGKVDYFANATTVTANAVWARVISIKVALLVRSLEPVLETNTAQTYNLFGETVTKTDRYLRRVYSTVIQLRNVVEN